jgi:hypothetical protein
MEELLRIFDAFLNALQESIDQFDENEIAEITQFIGELNQFITQQFPEQPPEQPPQEPEPGGAPQQPPSPDAQLLWILAGQNEQAFLQYLTNYPTQGTQDLLRNPEELQRVINYLTAMMPPGGEQPVRDGVPHADLNSSNIFGFRYNPKDGKLKVRFQSGSVYEYDKVPPNLFNAFRQGSAAAKTQGQNQFGRWWVGKNPSLGAAFHEYIRNQGFNYRRLR